MLPNAYPFVSALMITGKTLHHRKLANQAVTCFLQQDYPGPTELVIINTQQEPWFERVTRQLPGLNLDRTVREIVTPHTNPATKKPYTLGELRNISMQEAKGDLLLQWDDDDWYAPGRMRFQVENFVPGRINILKRQYRLNLLNGNWGLVDASGWPMGGIVGTMLHEPTTLQYPSLKKGEDTAFIKQFQVHCQNNEAGIYVRLYHGNNTWDKAKIMKPARGKGNKQGNAALIHQVFTLYTQ